jgi:hypothetical protein
MHRFAKMIAAFLLALLVSLPMALQADEQEAGTPQQQYSAIFSEYTKVSRGLRRATTDLGRKANVEEFGTYSSKFIELAAKHPEDPVALRALREAVQIVVSTDSAALRTWEINSSNYPTGSSDGSAAKTVEVVLRDHLLSDKLGPIIDRMRYGYRLDDEKCLTAVVNKSRHREMRGLACLALAQFLSDKLQMLQLTDDRPELVECYEIVFGKDYLPDFERLGRVKLAARIKSLFERTVNQYADVKFRNGTVGDRAKSELYAITNLGVGKVPPAMIGTDQYGKRFKLSDYRGKVVLLYFWSEY